MVHQVTVLPQKRHLTAPDGVNLLRCLRSAGLAPEAPCGGDGRCGKCTVLLDGKQVLACQTAVHRDMTITLPETSPIQVLTQGVAPPDPGPGRREGWLLAFDIGTTTVAGYLLEGETGRVLSSHSAPNPQGSFGADVISRIRHALQEQMQPMQDSIRRCLEELTYALCRKAGISPCRITIVSVVGNPAMQQLFLGIRPDNLARIPFAPVLTQGKTIPAKQILPLWENAQLLIIPDISGFVGADTVACVLSCDLDRRENPALLVDIGTNGEMVLGSRHRMLACSAAAGPALEGANILFGMRAQTGAIDHVWLEDGRIHCSVLGGGKARGICGSGLIDAVAVALDAGLLNARGNLSTENRQLWLTEDVYLTQEDIRQVQLAKGAIAAGIQLMARELGISLETLDTVYLAGAFGTFLDPRSACRIGLLPHISPEKIRSVGNAAGSGAQLLSMDPQGLDRAQQIASGTEFLELAALPDFRRCFAGNMRFEHGTMDHKSSGAGI